jgi:hypothetical protein
MFALPGTDPTGSGLRFSRSLAEVAIDGRCEQGGKTPNEVYDHDRRRTNGPAPSLHERGQADRSRIKVARIDSD